MPSRVKESHLQVLPVFMVTGFSLCRQDGFPKIAGGAWELEAPEAWELQVGDWL